MNNHPFMRRAGVALLIVLTALVVVGASISLALRANLAARAEARRTARRLQAEYLAVAGYDLAAAQLAADANYTGQTWDLAAEELGGQDRAVVVIEVAASAVGERTRAVTVVADYPAEAASVDRERHRFVMLWQPAESPSP